MFTPWQGDLEMKNSITLTLALVCLTASAQTPYQQQQERQEQLREQQEQRQEQQERQQQERQEQQERQQQQREQQQERQEQQERQQQQREQQQERQEQQEQQRQEQRQREQRQQQQERPQEYHAPAQQQEYHAPVVAPEIHPYVPAQIVRPTNLGANHPNATVARPTVITPLMRHAMTYNKRPGGVHITPDFFASHYGPAHGFHFTNYAGGPCIGNCDLKQFGTEWYFNWNGGWFGIMGQMPGYWGFETDYLYIDIGDDGNYYLYDTRFPDVAVQLTFVQNIGDDQAGASQDDQGN
jgi:hypothetical protein